MNIYHSYFKFWRNFIHKEDFCWIAITKTVPSDYIGNICRTLAPIGKEFDAVVNPFNESAFFKVYAKMLKSLDKQTIIDELKSFSKKGKDVVLLNWEDLSVRSEGRFAYAWMFNMKMNDADKYDLENILLEKKKRSEMIYGTNFLDL